MRITAGFLKGRPIAAPAGRDLRPTSDKVRQAIFNVLEHRDFGTGFTLASARVADLFAGTGALALEAISRGARYALLIDNSAEARAALRRNIEDMGLTGITKVWRREANDLGRNAGEAFDLAFLDPPYRKNLAAPALASLRTGGWLKPNAIIAVETAAAESIPLQDGFALVDERVYGGTRVAFLRPD